MIDISSKQPQHSILAFVRKWVALLADGLGAPGYYYSSPVAADNKVYIASEEGVVVLLDAGEQLKILATNKLDGAILATPALADGNIYVRTENHLYSFGK